MTASRRPATAKIRQEPSACPDPSSDHVYALLSLLGKVAGTPDDAVARVQMTLAGLGRLIGADAWAHHLLNGSSSRITAGAVNPGSATLCRRLMANQAVWDPVIRNAAKECPDSESRSIDVLSKVDHSEPFREIIRDAACVVTPHRHRVRCVLSFFVLDGHARFTASDRKMIAEIARAICVTPCQWSTVPESAVSLPRRLREVFEELASGASRRQIARRLGISIHTVGDYAKALYKRLGVSSQSELIRVHFALGKRSHSEQ